MIPGFIYTRFEDFFSTNGNYWASAKTSFLIFYSKIFPFRTGVYVTFQLRKVFKVNNSVLSYSERYFPMY